MAEEEPVSVSQESLVDHPHKRKLEDFEAPPSSDVAPPDSTLDTDGERKVEDDDVNGDDASEPSKRQRLDQMPDAFLANQNGHKAEEGNENTVAEAETVAAVEDALAAASGENAETAVDDQVGGDEHPVEALPDEENGVQPVSEGEQKVDTQDDKSDGKDVEVPSSENDQSENAEKAPGDEPCEPVAEAAVQGDTASGQHHPESGSKTISRKIEIPNNKVGVLIGKAGDTIKYLQINSGAKIQITRDAEADPHSATRPVELVGTFESINKAERLIKDVIAEADAGGSPSLVARGFNATMMTGSAEIEIHVPGDKVGLIIGRGGETIRSLQTRSGARIQLIPQNVPGDQSKEKKVKVTGDKKQIEIARELIKEQPGRPSQFSGNNYGQQQAYRPRGPSGAPQWGNRGPPSQPMPYDYHQQRGPYPSSQNQQYPPQPYGGYPPQGPPPRGGFGPGWDHRPPQGPPSHGGGGGGYDYYGHGGGGGHGPNAPVSAPHSAHMPGHPSGPQTMAPPSHSQPNYNYAHPRGGDYAQPTPYSQTAPQSYGHGYGEPKYDTQGPPPAQQQPYGAQSYPAPQQQQQYNRPPAYGMPPQGGAPPPQGYAHAGPPTATQPSADAHYQAQTYGQTVPPPQQYPYPSGGTPQAPYGSAPMTTDGYTHPQQQPQPAAAAGYPHQQQGAQPAYSQQAAGYPQATAPAGGYGQYPAQYPAQPGYPDQSAASGAAAYGYQGQVDPSAYAAASQAYSAAGQAYSAAAASAVAQQGYAQPVAAQPGYDQSGAPAVAAVPAAAAAAPVAYGKTLSPQPGTYPAQYDASAQQMYAAPR